MSVRAAVLSDVLSLVAAAKQGHAASIYRDVGIVDDVYARQWFGHAISNARVSASHGDYLVLVGHKCDEITGYFIGYVDRTYQIGNMLTAMDVHFYAGPDADPNDALRMLRHFTFWARSNPYVVEMLVGKTDIMGKDDGRYGSILKRMGFETFGAVFRCQVNREVEQAA